MGERVNTIVAKTFEYNLPDDYLHETDTKKLKGTFTYKGPDKIWVFVDNDSKKLYNTVYYTEHDDGDLIPTGHNHTKVCLDAENDALMMSMLVQQSYDDLSKKQEILPDGSVYERIDPPMPDHTYDIDNVEYDFINNVWKTPFPWKKPYMSWDEIKNARNSLLRESDMIIKNNNLTESQLTSIESYRQKLRDVPTTFAGIDPWKVPFPDLPADIKEIVNG